MRVPVGDALALAQPRLETLQVATALPINMTLRRLLRLFIPPSSHFDLNPRRQRVGFGDDKLYTLEWFSESEYTCWRVVQ